MKNTSTIILISIIGAIIAFIIWLNNKNENSSDLTKSIQPFFTTIEEKKIIPGNLYPLVEIEIKSPISGTLEKAFVQIGDKIATGDKIAQIKLVPDPAKIEMAKSNLMSAKINHETESKIYERGKILYDQHVIPPAEFEIIKKSFELSKEQFLSAQNQLTLIQEGFVKNADISNVVKSTTSGTVIDIPIKKGASVIERNNFNSGTTLVVVARLDSFIFRGKVNETDLVHLQKGMKINLKFNAFKNQTRTAILENISAKGNDEQGVMKYYIEASFGMAKDSLLIRSGYSANAEIILRKRENVLAIKEKYLKFQNDSAYVTIVKDGFNDEKRFVLTGLSDGINIEILKGLNKNEKIKIND